MAMNEAWKDFPEAKVPPARMTGRDAMAPRRAFLLAQHGAGVRPCLTGAGHWIGCTECGSCILQAGGLPKSKRVALVKELAVLAETVPAEEKPEKRFVAAWSAGTRKGRTA